VTEDPQTAVVDEYLESLDPESRAAFGRIRTLVTEVAPDVRQGTSYGVPALMFQGKPLLGFHAGKTFLSVYPYSGDVVTALRARVPGLETTSGSVHFTADEPLPDDAIRVLVDLRIAEIEGRALR
jgi:uncharacterized protein YdhG (YjbR/CyaY superfamily)